MSAVGKSTSQAPGMSPQDQYASVVNGTAPTGPGVLPGGTDSAPPAPPAPAPTGTASAPNAAVSTTPSGTMSSPIAAGSSGVAGKSSGMSQTPTPFAGTGGGTTGMSPAMQDFMKSQYFQGAYQNYFGSGQNGSNTPTI